MYVVPVEQHQEETGRKAGLLLIKLYVLNFGTQSTAKGFDIFYEMCTSITEVFLPSGPVLSPVCGAIWWRLLYCRSNLSEGPGAAGRLLRRQSSVLPRRSRQLRQNHPERSGFSEPATDPLQCNIRWLFWGEQRPLLSIGRFSESEDDLVCTVRNT